MPTNMADQVWRTGSIFSCCKGLWDVFLPKPITTKHQCVFWLVSQSRPYTLASAGGYHLRRLVLTLWYKQSEHKSSQMHAMATMKSFSGPSSSWQAEQACCHQLYCHHLLFVDWFSPFLTILVVRCTQKLNFAKSFSINCVQSPCKMHQLSMSRDMISNYAAVSPRAIQYNTIICLLRLDRTQAQQSVVNHLGLKLTWIFIQNTREMNVQAVKCVVCAGSSSEWVRCRRL